MKNLRSQKHQQWIGEIFKRVIFNTWAWNSEPQAKI